MCLIGMFLENIHELPIQACLFKQPYFDKSSSSVNECPRSTDIPVHCVLFT